MDSVPSLQTFNSQVPHSLPLLSCPSEPPDVGNWFSSYKYCSPDTESNFGLEESASRVTESPRDEEEKEEANLENVNTHNEDIAVKKLLQCSTCVEGDTHNKEACFTKSLDSFSSHSLLSEPQDIRNWFSSYVYESFVPDTCSMYNDDVVSEENDCDEETVDFKTINACEDLSENVQPKGNVEHKSSSYENRRIEQPSSKGDGTVETKRSLANNSTSHSEKILQPCMQDKVMQHNQENPGCNREPQVMSLDVKKGSEYRTEEMVQESKAKIQHDKVEMSKSLATTSTRNKENDGGFVSARKDKYPKENMPLQCSTNTGKVPLACEKQGATKRKALVDATNVVQSNAIEITGKWKCPQKGKPIVRPALKQLRLEKWVRRV